MSKKLKIVLFSLSIVCAIIAILTMVQLSYDIVKFSDSLKLISENDTIYRNSLSRKIVFRYFLVFGNVLIIIVLGLLNFFHWFEIKSVPKEEAEKLKAEKQKAQLQEKLNKLN